MTSVVNAMAAMAKALSVGIAPPAIRRQAELAIEWEEVRFIASRVGVDEETLREWMQECVNPRVAPVRYVKAKLLSGRW